MDSQLEPVNSNRSEKSPHQADCDRTDRLINRVAVGAVIILIGLIFLARQHGIELGFLDIDNWWALFILIPAAAMTVRVVARVRRLGRFDAEAGGTAIGAASTALVAALFLLELDFGKWWPLFIILGGLAVLLTAFNKEDDK